MSNWMFPLNMEVLGPTSDSWSYKDIDICTQIEVPIAVDEFDEEGRQNHFGVFGVKRRYN